MAEGSFRERNRQRREQNAFANLYAYATEQGIADPKRTAERAARLYHSAGAAGGPAGARGSPAGPRSGGRKTPHRLDDRTKEELYERAQELDIEGRSKMSKDELVDAIRAQQ